MINLFIALYSLGIFPTLALSSDEVNGLTAADVAELRALGASEAMLDRLRALARSPGGWLLNFQAQTVSALPPGHVPTVV